MKSIPEINSETYVETSARKRLPEVNSSHFLNLDSCLLLSISRQSYEGPRFLAGEKYLSQ